MKKLSYILRALRSPRKIIQSLSCIYNDEVYWDAYVHDWRKSGQASQLDCLGNEWKGEEIFLSLLEKYSSPRSHALEIGCGGGRITSRAAELFQRIHAADISSEMLRQCQRTLPYKNVSYHKLDGFTLREFSDSSIDLVFSHDVFVHFSSLQVYPYLQEIKRVIRTDGIALISFYNFFHHFELFKEMSFKFHNDRRFPPHMRVHFLTEDMLRHMLADLRLEIVEIEKTNFLISCFRRTPSTG
ncbi:class I SAM-dependent methyltransferase [Candidatus Acetothermia bacterium]|jgi:ubiquinone/menaquinone biosynthesis C-methylase UbiE|nr:class I SAM-dependent methyltransferase [Candidatus Acetothermia bacterium]